MNRTRPRYMNDIASRSRGQKRKQQHSDRYRSITRSHLSASPQRGANIHDSSQSCPVELEAVGAKKKRRRRDRRVKGCNCQKSRCLKLYCECYAKQIFCGSDCKCSDCHNIDDPKFDEDRANAVQSSLDRNTAAFFRAPTAPLVGLQRKGCKCKKSQCIKNYCECYQAGLGCMETCRCSGCANSHGTKPSSIINIGRLSISQPTKPQAYPDPRQKSRAWPVKVTSSYQARRPTIVIPTASRSWSTRRHDSSPSATPSVSTPQSISSLSSSSHSPRIEPQQEGQDNFNNDQCTKQEYYTPTSCRNFYYPASHFNQFQLVPYSPFSFRDSNLNMEDHFSTLPVAGLPEDAEGRSEDAEGRSLDDSQFNYVMWPAMAVPM